MKRWKMVISLLVLLLGAAGCAVSPATNEPTQAEKVVETATTQPTAVPQPSPSQPEPTAASTPVVLGNPVVIQPQNANQLVETVRLPVPMSYRLKWSANSSRLGVMYRDGLAILDGTTLDTLANIQVQDPYFLMGFSPETNLMAVTSDLQSIELRDISTGQVVRKIERNSQAYFAEFSPDGNTLAVGTTDQFAVEMWNVQTAVLTRTLTGFNTAAPVYSTIFSADGKFLIWFARASVQVMHIASGQMGPSLSHEDFVGGLALAPDDRMLAAGSAALVGSDYAPLVQLWDSNSGQQIGRLITPRGLPVSVSFSPDGGLLAGSSSSEVIVWDVSTQRELARISGFGDAVNASIFSPDGKTLAVSSSDGTVRLYQVLE